MKRLYLLLTMAVALLASCAKDATTTVVDGSEALVSFEIQSPKTQTRYGDGSAANQLFYAVYQDGNMVENLSVLPPAKAVDINLTTNLQISLIKGLEYDILFWAQNENGPYDFDGAKVTIDYNNLLSNEEIYDAFFCNYHVAVDDTNSHLVELSRPFAQLNVATDDIEKAKDAGFDLAQTSVTDIIIPSDISEIKDYVFRDCSSIVSITIHEGVEKIGKQAIGSEYLEKVYFKSTTPPTIVHDTFFDLRNATIYVPAEAVDDYKQAEYWSEYADNIFAEE